MSEGVREGFLEEVVSEPRGEQVGVYQVDELGKGFQAWDW